MIFVILCYCKRPITVDALQIAPKNRRGSESVIYFDRLFQFPTSILNRPND
jgi:hypothetical protein